MSGKSTKRSILILIASLSLLLAFSGGVTAQDSLVGELEGITLILDPAEFPIEFNEAPMLAELVA